MPEHIDTTTLVIGLVVMFLFRFVALTAFLVIMVKIQKLDFAWLPLVGSALLGSALDMVPLVGHFIAVPVLYLCIWKCVRCDTFRDATFTVVLSYALVRCLTFVALAYMPFNLHPKSGQDTKYDLASLAPDPAQSATNAVTSLDPPSQAPAQQVTIPAAEVPDVKSTSGISIKGFSRIAGGAMVTFQSGKKIYTLSLGEDTTVSTDSGFVTVRFIEAGKNDVTLAVGDQTEKYAVN
jgi:hypothetical protein